jgi:hypothetical protein
MRDTHTHTLPIRDRLDSCSYSPFSLHMEVNVLRFIAKRKYSLFLLVLLIMSKISLSFDQFLDRNSKRFPLCVLALTLKTIRGSAK